MGSASQRASIHKFWGEPVILLTHAYRNLLKSLSVSNADVDFAISTASNSCPQNLNEIGDLDVTFTTAYSYTHAIY